MTAVGRFSTPPVLGDLAALPLPPADLEDLRRCRPGACAINLPASAIERLNTDVVWSASDAPARAEALMREILLDYVRRYQTEGNDALVVYLDRGEPISVKDSSLRLFQQAEVLTARMPTLSTYFYYFPKAPLPPGAHETYYWSQAGFGLKPVTRVNHAVLAPVSPGGTRGWIMASRQLYASHYFRDALELRFIHPDTANPSGYYFVCIYRALSDSLRGVTGTLVGGVVRKEVREGMARYVTAVKRAMEGA